jgi:co-chaperonin GroES (HSP10)
VSLKPLNDRILIYQTKAPENFTSTDGVSKSKIIIPDDLKKKNQPNTGMVLAVGEIIKEKHSELKLGEIVLFEKHAGADVQLLNNNGVVMSNLLMVKYEDLVSGFVDDGYFYDDLLKPIHDEEEKQKADDEKRAQELTSFKEALNDACERSLIYQCWNGGCKSKLLEVPKSKREDWLCEYCGGLLTEKQEAPSISVKGGTPRFHN